MEEMKHTAGPWMQDKYGNVQTPSGNTLVTEGVALGGCSTEETRANARLIAAAPELLEALQDMLVLQAGISADPQDTLQRARAAISQATGQSK